MRYTEVCSTYCKVYREQKRSEIRDLILQLYYKPCKKPLEPLKLLKILTNCRHPINSKSKFGLCFVKQLQDTKVLTGKIV